MKDSLIYNTEVRMYSWVALFVLLSFYFLLRILETNEDKYYIWFAIMSLCSGYTHYYGLLSVSFFYLALIIYSIFKNKEYIKKTIITSLLTVIRLFALVFYLTSNF